MDSSRRSALLRLVVAAGLTAAVVSLALAWTGRSALGSVRWWLVAAAVLAGFAGNSCSAAGWAALNSEMAAPRAARWSYYAAILGKYVPVGVAQQAGMVVTLRRASTGKLAATSAAAVVQAAVSVAAAATFLLPALMLGLIEKETLRIVLLIGVSTLLVSLFAARSGWGGRKVRNAVQAFSLRMVVRHVPRAVVWNVVGFLLMSASFGACVFAIGEKASLALQSSALFPVAWVAGFVVWFLPAGAGARESALLWLSAGAPEALIRAALLHRLAILVADIASFVVFRGWLVPVAMTEIKMDGGGVGS